ncbi:MAG: phosphate signaling complex protein PhoU [Alphaproteobacteria bacterium]|nr:phosphate signaling complex protein PhoU [Alphaproteobacteria bacterium]
MPEHTVKAFSEELDALANEIARMGGLAEQAVIDSIAAVVRRDTRLANEIIERDAQIDREQREVERRAIKLMALRHPFAADLRQVLTAWRISGDLERIGDLAKNIAKRTLVLNQSDPIQITKGIERMGKIAAFQLKTVLDSYARGDVQAALSVWMHDEDIDAHYNSLFRELLTYMMEDPRTISPCAHLLFVAKNIERIGDHCTNIAEMVHYLVTGEEMSAERPRAKDDPTPVDPSSAAGV